MNPTQHLFQQFSQGINWNALFYISYKLSFTLLSFLLFRHLTTTQFSTWANTNSIIFLLLLWIDCGLRKSIPRFCPITIQNPPLHRTFITSLILGQATILTLSLPLFWYLLSSLATTLDLHQSTPITYLAAAVFLTEGLVNILRLIYHAHFWIKQFNSLSLAIIALETFANLILITTHTTSAGLLEGIFITKLCSSALLVIITLARLPNLNKTLQHHTTSEAISTPNIARPFIKHSCIMWFNNILKSLSERNFLVPLLTHTLGPLPANIFKLANDGSLLFYRSITKTVGTTDTALLSYAANQNHGPLMSQAFKELCHKVMLLSLLFLGLLLICIISSSSFNIDQSVLHLFYLLATSSLIEAVLSPFERLLEVHYRYWTLLISYLPYILGIALLMGSGIIASIGLWPTIFLIQLARLSGSILTTIYARHIFPLFCQQKGNS